MRGKANLCIAHLNSFSYPSVESFETFLIFPI